MSSTPDVSVVMGVYNGADTLDETMQSILTQEGVDFEFIVVDDGSMDSSSEILDGYARRDARVRVLHQDNAGLTHSLISGCAAARGQYIARQDAGDRSLPERLKLQKALLDEHDDCVLVSCWTSWVGPNGEELFVTKGRGSTCQPTDIIAPTETWGTRDGPTSHPSVMFRRSVYEMVGGYRSAFRFGQDWDLWYRLAERGKFATIEQSLVQCLISSGSISSVKRDQQARYAKLSHKALLVRLLGNSESEVLEEAKRLGTTESLTPISDCGSSLYFIGKCLLDNNDGRATSYFLSAIASNPFLWRAWWWAAISLIRHPTSAFHDRRAR